MVDLCRRRFRRVPDRAVSHRDSGDEHVRYGFGMGADVLRVGVRGAEEHRFDGVGEERSAADYDQAVERGVGDEAVPAGLTWW